MCIYNNNNYQTNDNNNNKLQLQHLTISRYGMMIKTISNIIIPLLLLNYLLLTVLR